MSEGLGINAAARITGKSKNTVLKLLVDIGAACAAYQNDAMRNLTITQVQVDEIWSFVGTKHKSVTEDPSESYGDCYTFMAIDPVTKLMPCWLVGTRSAENANDFMRDLAGRLANRVRLTSDGLEVYPAALDKTFDEQLNSAMLNMSCSNQDGLSVRMGMRRFTLLNSVVGQKLENYMHAVSFYIMVYNFVKIHQSIKATPAIAAGVTTRLWSMEDIVMMTETT